VQTTATLTARERAVTRTYWPLIRGYLVVSFIYYFALTIAHFFHLLGDLSVPYFFAVAPSSLLLGAMTLHCRKPGSIRQLIMVTSVVHGVVLFNVIAGLTIDFNEDKLVYFLIIAMIFAFTSLSQWQAVIASAVAMIALAVEISIHDTQRGVMYAFIALGAAVASSALSYYLRGIIISIAEAEEAAQIARTKAEKRMSEAQTSARLMKKNAMSDSLTGLPNRRAFFDMLEQQMASEAEGWVILMDLDGFKHVNDTYGHVMGDEVLKAVSFRSRRYCEDVCAMSRLGGDEFGAVLNTAMSEEELVEWAQGLLSRLAQLYPIEGRYIQISASIGCCRISHAGSETELFQNADFALLHAKRSGKNRVVTFDDEQARAFAERFKIEQGLRSAKLKEHIWLRFQPQFCLRTNRIVRAEALARWEHPELGPVMPQLFVEVAEECGLITKLTLAVIEQAIEIVGTQGHELPLSINLSANDLNANEATDAIVRMLDEHSFDPRLLEFEVTETAMLNDLERATQNLKRLAQRGHPIAIDDFGTGYSNYEMLLSLPIDKIKIDRAFIQNPQNPRTEKILRSMVEIARALDVDCLLEGVEDELGLLLARRVGLGLVQGYHISPPCSLEALDQLELYCAAG